MNALAQIDTHYSNLIHLHAPMYNVAGKKNWQPNPDLTEAELDVMKADQKMMMQHAPVENTDDMIKHLREMIKAGYTDEEIKNLHPELQQTFGNANGPIPEETSQT